MSWNRVTKFVQQSRDGLINILGDELQKSRDLISLVDQSHNNVQTTPLTQHASEMSFGRIESLGADILAHIYTFLEAEDLCAMRGCNVLANAAFHLGREKMWKFHYELRFGGQSAQENEHGASHFCNYLSSHLSNADQELQHAKSLAHCYQALSHYFAKNPNGQGVFGMVCDLFWADNEPIAMALSRNRYWAMPTIIVDTEQRVYEFKKATSSGVRNGPASFLPLSMAAQSFQDASEEYRFMDSDELLRNIPGFIGYAINLLHMKREHEFLKFTVLPILFKNLMVFESVELKEDYEMTLPPEFRQNFRGIGLDENIDGQVILPESMPSKVYPCFRWKSCRPSYYRNYRFLNEKSEANSQNRLQICTHSCSNSHSSCDCRSVNDALTNNAMCVNIARPLRGSISHRQQSTSSSKNLLLNSLDKMVQGIEKQISNTKQSLSPLIATAVSASGLSTNTSAGDCFYVSKVIEDLEKRVDRAKLSYTIVRYSY